MNEVFAPLLANGWSHVEHMFYFLVAFGGGGFVLTLILALRPSTRRWALIVGGVVLVVCLAVLIDLWSRL